jgi:uncharacterized protein (TIGR04141 family)
MAGQDDDKTQALAIRLLRNGRHPEDSVREGVALAHWDQNPGWKISFGPMGGAPPKWADFLELTGDEKKSLRQNSTFGLVFVPRDGRWFAVSFGMGHVKLDPDAFEQDFGLKVVLNAVDPKKLRSADLRTPDANTVSRRSQTSRRSEQSAFEIDAERDIVRGLMGEPKETSFGSKVSGGDALTLRRKAHLAQLPDICAQALTLYGKDEYKEAFGWIDQVRHVRDQTTLTKLWAALAAAVNEALTTGETDDLHLAYPVIYDPDKAGWVKFKGYRDRTIFPDLELVHYIDGLKAAGIAAYGADMLTSHSVQECDENGISAGGVWKIAECAVYETEIDGSRYVLSGGRWYEIADDLAKEVTDFFAAVEKTTLPDAEAGDNEETYNDRQDKSATDMVCLDRKLLKPTGAASAIEVCDFFGDTRRFIHVKDKTSSSRLSHLFSQGAVSAVLFKRDQAMRAALVNLVAAQPKGAKFAPLLPQAGDDVVAGDFTVVFGVLVNSAGGKDPKLPFFSLVSFRQAARQIRDELGFKLQFAWVKKPSAGAGKKVAKKPAS